jgi:signal transduction histidine kinase
MAKNRRRNFGQYLGPLTLLLWLLSVVVIVWFPITEWLQGEERYERQVLREWIQESRIYRTLPELIREYIDLTKKYRQAAAKSGRASSAETVEYGVLKKKREELSTQLKSLADPLKVYKSQLPLFPVIYRLELSFPDELELPPIIWDSELPRQEKQYRKQPERLDIRPDSHAFINIHYHTHVFSAQQAAARQERQRQWRLIIGLFIVTPGLVLLVSLDFFREWRRQRQRLLAEQQLHEVDRRRLEEELRRQEAERKHQEAERVNLELKSQLWANIGIMAGSYAHNIKNLLVRPNDLISRCLEGDRLTGSQGQMLQEVRQTLGTVTERLQQILQTVRRDPTQARRERLDLNLLMEDIRATWQELARERWKLTLTLERAAEPLWIEGDPSHLQQALENLLFNARDATFEMRNYLREQARRPDEEGEWKVDDRELKVENRETAGLSRSSSILDPRTSSLQKQALIAAAAWKGEVVLRTYRDGDCAVLEVRDNGIGMTEEIRQRCTETHFSTKRNNALFAGLSAGMGLGLSFVLVILEHHQARLTIESAPLQGTIFRVSFPFAALVSA